MGSAIAAHFANVGCEVNLLDIVDKEDNNRSNISNKAIKNLLKIKPSPLTLKSNINLIKSGVLTNLIHSEATARKFGVQPTGHAGLGAKVSVSPDWLVVSKSDYEDDQQEDLSIKETLLEYILIDELSALHSGVKASQGSFSLPFDGWHVKDGQRKSIESATIAGDFLTLIKNLVQIEDIQYETHQGVSPHVWVEELAVTGDV